MKTKNTKVMMMLIALALSIGASSQAQDFGGKNGGDVQEKRFNLIAQDIKEWISKGGAKKLALPENVSLEKYESSMLQVIVSYGVSFTSDVIIVNGVEKDCENIPSLNLIRCNIERFKNASESDQYVITHHEFAGLAGLESNEGKVRSDYTLSSQITKSLQLSVVLKLAVEKDYTGAMLIKMNGGGMGTNPDITKKMIDAAERVFAGWHPIKVVATIGGVDDVEGSDDYKFRYYVLAKNADSESDMQAICEMYISDLDRVEKATGTCHWLTKTEN